MNINRFIEAQNRYHNIALNELKNGRKQSHWMWFIFPQLQGLGSSSMAQYYAINDINEAKEYWSNEYLRKNYLELCEVLLNLDDNNSKNIFGYIDSIKLQSSLTLFYQVEKIELIKKLIDKFYNGELDIKTINILNK